VAAAWERKGMAVYKRGGRWYHDFMIRRVRYRAVIPEAQNKYQAEKAEAKVKVEIYEGRYGAEPGNHFLSDFIEQVYLPWARANKRHPRNDEMHCKVIREFFAGKALSQISPLLVEKFKRQRGQSMTRYGTPSVSERGKT
jgi:hypothetical protein